MSDRGWQNLSADFVSDIEGQWSFDGVLTDGSGNSLTLTHSGTAAYARPNSLQGIYLTSSDLLDRASNDSELTITGGLTIHAQVFFNAEPASEQRIVRFDGGDDTQANNTLYQLSLSSSNTFQYFAEEGAGNDITFDFGVGVTLGRWHLLTLVRTPRGQVTLYIDGQQAGSSSTALAVPDGGTTSVIEIGGGSFEGWIGGVIIASSASSATDVATQFAHVSAGYRHGRWQTLDPNLTSGIQGNWGFENVLTDGSGNGLTLLDAGNGHTQYFGGTHGIQGVWLDPLSDGDYHLERTSNDTELTITGELTVWYLYHKLVEAKDGVYYSFFPGTGGETEADNILYNYLDSGIINNDPLFTVVETGPGTNVEFFFDHHIPYGGWHLHVMTRDSSGDVRVYCDGDLAGLQSSGLSAPSGGTNSRLQIGEDPTEGYLGHMIICNSEASPADVWRMWNHVQNGGGRQPAASPRRVYRMRAFNTNSGTYVHWNAFSNDTGGLESPFDPADLSDITVSNIISR